MHRLVHPVKELCDGPPLGSEDPSVSQVVPLFIPSSFVEAADWPGPYAALRAQSVALTWAVVLPDQAIRYVPHEMRREWEARGIDWKTRALDNLRELSPEPVGTGALFRDNGETWLISLMHSDGLGPSRLLLTDQLEGLFPNGYRVALPERSRGFAFAAELDAEDADTVESLIQSSYWKGARPLSPEIFDPSDLLSATPRSTR
ncbi:MAG: hypothetical protein WBE37_18435 [Bryobacteraceae bacterium]